MLLLLAALQFVLSAFGVKIPNFLLLMSLGSSLVGWDTLFGEGGSEGMVQLLLAAFMAEAAVSVASLL